MTIPSPNLSPETGGAGLGSAFAAAPEGGTQPAASFNPGMFGDLIGIQARRAVFIAHGTTMNPNPVRSVGGNFIAVVAPVPYHASFKITENESPRPTDRAYVSYNYYSDVTRLTPGLSDTDLHRETIGFEKTFLDGDASFGIRLPFLQLVGDSNVEDNQVGDLSLIFKYALLNDRRTGDVFSTGMVLTLPTGKDVTIDGATSLHATVFQPFLGYIVNFDSWYLQGFSSLAVPTDFRDVTLLFNSVGVGYKLYQNNSPDVSLHGIVPVAELHLNTPLNHRGLNEADPISYPDGLDGTIGVHLIFQRVNFGLAVGTPLIGPRPYDVEALANLNFTW